MQVIVQHGDSDGTRKYRPQTPRKIKISRANSTSGHNTAYGCFSLSHSVNCGSRDKARSKRCPLSCGRACGSTCSVRSCVRCSRLVRKSQRESIDQGQRMRGTSVRGKMGKRVHQGGQKDSDGVFARYLTYIPHRVGCTRWDRTCMSIFYSISNSLYRIYIWSFPDIVAGGMSPGLGEGGCLLPRRLGGGLGG